MRPERLPLPASREHCRRRGRAVRRRFAGPGIRDRRARRAGRLPEGPRTELRALSAVFVRPGEDVARPFPLRFGRARIVGGRGVQGGGRDLRVDPRRLQQFAQRSPAGQRPGRPGRLGGRSDAAADRRPARLRLRLFRRGPRRVGLSAIRRPRHRGSRRLRRRDRHGPRSREPERGGLFRPGGIGGLQLRRNEGPRPGPRSLRPPARVLLFRRNARLAGPVFVRPGRRLDGSHGHAAGASSDGPRAGRNRDRARARGSPDARGRGPDLLGRRTARGRGAPGPGTGPRPGGPAGPAFARREAESPDGIPAIPRRRKGQGPEGGGIPDEFRPGLRRCRRPGYGRLVSRAEGASGDADRVLQKGRENRQDGRRAEPGVTAPLRVQPGRSGPGRRPL